MSYTLYWSREDNQGEFNMGTFPTREEAESAIKSARQELIDQCPGPHVDTNEDFTKCRDEVLAGEFSIHLDE